MSFSFFKKINPYFYLLFFIFIFAGYTFGSRPGLLLALSLCFFIFAICLFFSDAGFLGAQKLSAVSGHDPWRLNVMVHRIEKELKLPQTQIFICPSPQLFAYSTSQFDQKGVLVLSPLLLQKLSPLELEIVVTRQLLLIQQMQKSGTHFVHLLAQSFFGTSSMIKKSFGFRFWPFDLVSYLLLFLFFRKRFTYRLDQESLAKVNEPRAFGNILWKLQNSKNAFGFSSHHLMFNPLGTNLTPLAYQRIQKICGYFPL